MQHIDWRAILGYFKAIEWQTVTAVLAFVFSIYTFRKTHKLSEKQAGAVVGALAGGLGGSALGSHYGSEATTKLYEKVDK